ncbi:hypothetical protein NPX13_g1073 [Xylaria arbuscula]|uniref:Heterokaryon incompatibility domain-containing protein n=1 Tax=Xylaria arbuscula TaxID=114810 RepID=A0A9W8NN46_9PEZI|nr:hypothetical protein NPX13_g1073 [Xylaria arbuscula]
MHSKAQCPFCERVKLVLAGYSEQPSRSEESKLLTVGTYADIRRSQDCDICQFVIERLNENPVRDAYQDRCPVAFWRWAPTNDYLYTFGPVEGETNCLTCDLDHHTLTLADLELVDIDPNWIDLDRVRAWARSCDTDHAGTCHNLDEWASIPPPSLAPLLLVDVISKCLVEIAADRIVNTRYVALSYVWGQLRDVLETTRANEQDLRKEHALESPSCVARLPGTVRDAIELVSRLGLPYLWVDRLCIVQDDLDRKLPQLEQMGAIYANAYMTLVAADGDDANHGLRGSFPGVASPRVLGSPRLSFTPTGKPLVVEPEFAPRTGPGEWHRRGWTFQERTLSNRNLVFQQGRVFWECRGAVWTEELAFGPSGASASHLFGAIPRNQNTKPSAYRTTLSRWPDLVAYEILVRTYSELLLSFPTDALRAFTGIINTVSRSFPGGMLYGIPEYFFDYGLLWAPYTPIQRRLVSGRRDPSLPSWSWAGWTGGGINLSIVPMIHQRFNAQRGIMPWDNIEIYPKIDWHKINQDNGTSQKINNGYDMAVEMKKDKSISLSEGWSRVSETQDGATREGFIHAHLPRDIFLWPLHIPDRPLDEPAGSFQPYLRFRASRAFLVVGERLEHAWEEKVWSVSANAVVPRASMLHLYNDSGDWAGIVISNEAKESQTRSREVCECIVISEGFAWRDTCDEETILEEWNQVNVIKSLPKYEFYNILWIEWERGIAYRKAVGRVWREAWKQLETLNIDVILG